MSTKVTFEFDARFEHGMRRALAMFEEMEQLALTAPDGHVFDVCEEAVIDKGRQLQAATLGEAVARRIEAAEKKRGFDPALCVRSQEREPRAQAAATDERGW